MVTGPEVVRSYATVSGVVSAALVSLLDFAASLLRADFAANFGSLEVIANAREKIQGFAK
jgi:hypothetical protein